MTTGTLAQVSGAVKQAEPYVTSRLVPEQGRSPEIGIPEWLLGQTEKNQFFSLADFLQIASFDLFRHAAGQGNYGTATSEWYPAKGAVSESLTTVWDSLKLKKLLAEPLGSPVELTREEADQIVWLAFGRRPDLPPGKQFVEEVREILGHSMMERLREAE